MSEIPTIREHGNDFQPVAGNGLLDRRILLRSGLALAGLATARVVDAETLQVPVWSRVPGSPFSTYGQPSRFESKVVRLPRTRPGTPGTGSSRTPLQFLKGTVTPNGLHFERNHNGTPDIDPDAHRFLIHGLVKRPLLFTLEALARYPMVSRMAFIECAGNSDPLLDPEPVDADVQAIHGLVSCAEWTGVPLSLLLDEAGVDPSARWILAEGSDAAAFSRSVPLAIARDDAVVALYQNGERLRPANGYPMRLLLPGCEGSMQIKWLRRIKLTAEPTMTRDETSHYTMLLRDGRVAQFKYPMDTKSVITQPSPGLTLHERGLYEISGLAWSGAGRITKVEVSADGGHTWGLALLSEPALPKAFTRFRMPWHWSGGAAILQSRATDESGYVQPSRAAQIAARGDKVEYHCNAITSWRVDESGSLRHVFV